MTGAPATAKPPGEPTEFGEFMRTVRRALLLIVAYIERRYGT